MKKSRLIAAVLVLGLLVVGGFLPGCAGSDSTTSSTTTASTLGGDTASTSATGESPVVTAPTSTTAATTSTTVAARPTVDTSKDRRHQQSDSHIVYKGTWKISAAEGASGGTLAFANSAGASVTITFNGTHLALIAKKSPKYGKAKITLDGKYLGTIDLYSSQVEYRQKVWGTGALAPGSHTVVIAWAGTKRAAATDTNINIDAVDLTGTLE